MTINRKKFLFAPVVAFLAKLVFLFLKKESKSKMKKNKHDESQAWKKINL